MLRGGYALAVYSGDHIIIISISVSSRLGVMLRVGYVLTVYSGDAIESPMHVWTQHAGNF